ncbi:serine carboxypeptidase [Russula earlei]|uniref:Serine carboxypeptidase n=1 Tax=Russula earlei TaxID=71964 RepID=A0ACC0U066_9AGAM|nr:serine carboxypeptidase [Russula earlei]
MFSRLLPALPAFVGVAVAALQLRVQLPGSSSVVPAQLSTQAEVTQTSVDHSSVHGDRPFGPQFEPVGELSAISSDQWTTLSHPVFPSYTVRIKQSRFCDTTVRAYTGYIDFEARHLFFYFFESRNAPDRDDVIFWTNGGPGCSSSLGLFMELGPCRVTSATDDPQFFKESWNSNANVFFVDQPVGVGFSYAEHGQSVSTSEEAARDIAAFIAIFFEHFHSFKGRAFHMAGESYGGRYIPLFASVVYDQNALLAGKGLTPINLKSIIIGNGYTDPSTMTDGYYYMTCTPSSLPPVVDISSCVRMKKALPRCKKWLKDACMDMYDAMNCKAASTFCSTEISQPFYATGLNYYDMSSPCLDPKSLCYPVITTISRFLDRPDIRATLGVDPHVPQNFTSCSEEVSSAFDAAGDHLQSSTEYIAALLARQVRVLIYVGTYDWICNWVGNEAWTLALEWHGQRDFAALPLREWHVDGRIVGKTRGAHGLTFATVDKAGHMVPYDKPKEAVALINRWLAQEEL